MARSCQEISTFKFVPLWEQTYPQNVHNMDSYIIVRQYEGEMNEYVSTLPWGRRAQYIECTYEHITMYGVEYVFSSRSTI